MFLDFSNPTVLYWSRIFFVVFNACDLTAAGYLATKIDHKKAVEREEFISMLKFFLARILFVSVMHLAIGISQPLIMSCLMTLFKHANNGIVGKYILGSKKPPAAGWKKVN